LEFLACSLWVLGEEKTHFGQLKYAMFVIRMVVIKTILTTIFLDIYSNLNLSVNEKYFNYFLNSIYFANLLIKLCLIFF